MKILYGVQATGNGHITRARSLAPELKKKGLEVDYLFSGRRKEELFDMEVFGDYRVCKGMTFITADGKVQYLKTFQDASLRQLWKDIRSLDLSQYDLVITDYEPVTAWAAKLQKKPVIGVGHQYAFNFEVPLCSSGVMAEWVMRWFAPAKLSLGVHWHHFNAPILPPIIHTQPNDLEEDSKSVLVYLPFENSRKVMELLKPFKGWKFRLHCKDVSPGEYGNVEVFPFSRDGFQTNLKECQSVLCNAGFELVSEALHLGKRVLVKPLSGQMEQASNAKALDQLSFAWKMNHLNPETIEKWLSEAEVIQVNYPPVAEAIAEWLLAGTLEDAQTLADQLWSQVHSPQRPDLFQESISGTAFA